MVSKRAQSICFVHESDFKGKAQSQYKNNAALQRAHSNHLFIEFINPNISIY